MRRLAVLVACAGCDGVFHVDEITPADAAVGSGSGVDAPRPPADAQTIQTYCDTVMPTPQFCLDFDQGKYDIVQFSKLVQANGTLTTTADTSESAPNEMVATITGTGASTAFGEYDPKRPYAGVFDFWVRIPNGGCMQNIAVVSWMVPSEVVTVAAGKTGLGASSVGGACAASVPAPVTVALDSWNHVSISIGTNSFDVSINGTSTLSATCNTLSGAPQFQVGVQGMVTSSSGFCATELDNVIVH